MIEKSTSSIADFVGLMLKPNKEKNRRDTWPTPSNTTKSWIADFVSLGLFEPSKKKHSVKDTEEYWTLTQPGRELHAHIRRLVLEGEEPVSATAVSVKTELPVGNGPEAKADQKQ
jgi:hypothetical protein